MRKRTRARQLALEVLYQVDLLGAGALGEALADMTERSDDPMVGQFAASLVRGTLDHLADIDRILQEVAQNWDLSRMATVDRNVLRLGAYELLHREDIPPKVSINEAIDLAKAYSTAESGTFVNGILDRVKNAYAPKAKSSDSSAEASAMAEASAEAEKGPGDAAPAEPDPAGNDAAGETQ